MLDRHFGRELPAASARPDLFPFRAAINIAAPLKFKQVSAVSQRDPSLFDQRNNIRPHLFASKNRILMRSKRRLAPDLCSAIAFSFNLRALQKINPRADNAAQGKRGVFDGKISSSLRPYVLARRAQETFPIKPAGPSQSSADHDSLGIESVDQQTGGDA